MGPTGILGDEFWSSSWVVGCCAHNYLSRPIMLLLLLVKQNKPPQTLSNGNGSKLREAVTNTMGTRHRTIYELCEKIGMGSFFFAEIA